MVPLEKIGQPEEACCTQARRIKVEADGTDLGDREADDRRPFWFTRNALENGRESTTLDLDSPLADIDLSRVNPILIVIGLALGTASAIALGRSYDFLPALRGVQSRWLYGLVRHPMYLSSILIRLGYVVRNCTAQNLLIFVAMVWLYDRRARYEERVMENDEAYRQYAAKVRFRFIPFLY